MGKGSSSEFTAEFFRSCTYLAGMDVYSNFQGVIITPLVGLI